MRNPKFHQCASCGYEWKRGKHGGHDCVETLNAHYEALREKCEELNNEMLALRDSSKRRAEVIVDLQRQRDEAAKQEPVGEIMTKPFGSDNKDMCILHWVSDYRPKQGDKLYAKPINLPDLPDLIEQARAEEQERIGKLIHYPECWDTSAYPTLEAALMEIHHCSQCYENRDAAIRARSGK